MLKVTSRRRDQYRPHRHWIEWQVLRWRTNRMRCANGENTGMNKGAWCWITLLVRDILKHCGGVCIHLHLSIAAIRAAHMNLLITSCDLLFTAILEIHLNSAKTMLPFAMFGSISLKYCAFCSKMVILTSSYTRVYFELVCFQPLLKCTLLPMPVIVWWWIRTWITTSPFLTDSISSFIPGFWCPDLVLLSSTTVIVGKGEWAERLQEQI